MMKFDTIKGFIMVLGAIVCLSGCAPEKKDDNCTLNPNVHTNTDKIESLNTILNGDTIKANNTNFDLYIDFSATMKKALSDHSFKTVLENTFYKGGNNVNCYRIGTNPDVLLIKGDGSAKKNEILDPIKYDQQLTFMAPNLNNIVNNTKQTAFMFTDFSVDEGKPTKSLVDNVTSTFVRGPEYKDQFEKWFRSGGSIRIYGKMLGSNPQTPIYVIAFLPAGFSNENPANSILKDLDEELGKEIYFNFHSNFVSVQGGRYTRTSGAELISDSLGLSLSGKSKAFKNGKGEVHIYDGTKLIQGIKLNKTVVSKSLFYGIQYTVDTTSFLKSPVFEADYKEYACKDKSNLSENLSDVISYFEKINQDKINNKLLVPLNYQLASKDNTYNADHFYRISFNVIGGELNFNDKKAASLLQYNIKSIVNNCLYLSIKGALTAVSQKIEPQKLYSVNTYIKKSSK